MGKKVLQVVLEVTSFAGRGGGEVVLNGCYPHGLAMRPRVYLTSPLLTKERNPEQIQFEKESANSGVPMENPEGPKKLNPFRLSFSHQ